MYVVYPQARTLNPHLSSHPSLPQPPLALTQICLGAAMSMDALCELGAVPFIRRVAPFARRLFATCAAAFLVGAPASLVTAMHGFSC